MVEIKRMARRGSEEMGRTSVCPTAWAFTTKQLGDFKEVTLGEVWEVGAAVWFQIGFTQISDRLQTTAADSSVLGSQGMNAPPTPSTASLPPPPSLFYRRAVFHGCLLAPEE